VLGRSESFPAIDEATEEFLLEDELLIADAGPDRPASTGVMGASGSWSISSSRTEDDSDAGLWGAGAGEESAVRDD
jgi:hypothetical protein